MLMSLTAFEKATPKQIWKCVVENWVDYKTYQLILKKYCTKQEQQKTDQSIITIRWLVWTKHFEFSRLLSQNPGLHWITFQVYNSVPVDGCLVSE